MRVPIIISEPPPEFGELQGSPEFHEATGMNGDYTYVPGFSEKRLARDMAILEVTQGKRRSQDVPTLPHNFRWARCQNKAGEPDSRKVISAGNRGYVTVTAEQVGPGKLLESLPAGAKFNAAGQLQQGDVVLMIADAPRVARNEFNKRVKTESATKGAEAGFEAALATVGGRPTRGAAPFIQKEVGQAVRAELSPKSKAER